MIVAASLHERSAEPVYCLTLTAKVREEADRASTRLKVGDEFNRLHPHAACAEQPELTGGLYEASESFEADDVFGGVEKAAMTAAAGNRSSDTPTPVGAQRSEKAASTPR